MSRIALASLLVLLVSGAAARAQTRIGASADVGYTHANLAGGLGPSAGVQVRHRVGAGAVLAAMRLDVVFIDRQALAADYMFDAAAGTCSDVDGPVDPYVCNDLGTPGTSALGAYSAEIAYAPTVPVAVGVGVRWGEEVDREEGKRFGVARPYATVIGTLPATPNLAVQARARAGVGLVEARLGLAVSF